MGLSLVALGQGLVIDGAIRHAVSADDVIPAAIPSSRLVPGKGAIARLGRPGCVVYNACLTCAIPSSS
jgi:hypothetical protein